MLDAEKRESGFQSFHTPERLKKFMEDYDLLLDIDNEQCRCLIENLKKEGMQLGADDGDSKLKVFCNNGIETSISEITIDDAIDIACDVAYDKVLEINQKLESVTGSENKIKVLEDAVKRLKESAVLDKLYVQTIYFKQSVAASYETLHQAHANANVATRNNKKKR